MTVAGRYFAARLGLLALLVFTPEAGGQPAAPGVAGAVVRVELTGGGDATDVASWTLVEAGEPRPVLAVEPEAGPWRIVVYFDQLTGRRRTSRNAAVELSELARRLTGSGTVEAVVAGRDVTGVMPQTRDPLVVAETLSWLSVREVGRDAQHGVRVAFAETLASVAGDEAGEAALHRMTAVASALGAAMAEEEAILVQSREQLIAWAAENADGSPTLLLLVSGGWDDDPPRHYASALAGAGFQQLGKNLGQTTIEPSAEDVARVLAGYGMTVVPLVPDTETDIFLTEDDASAGSGPELPEGQPEPRFKEVTAGVDLLGLRRRKRPEDGVLELSFDRDTALESLAAATAGRIVRDGRQLEELLDGLSRRRRLRFDARAAHDGVAAVEVRAAGLQVRSPAFVAEATPEPVSALRARQTLAGDAIESELPVAAALRLAPTGVTGLTTGELLVELGPEVEASRLRATVSVGWGEERPSVFHRLLGGAPGSGGIAWHEDEASGGRIYTLPVPLPGGSGSRVAVVVEDLDRRLWGASLATFLEGSPSAEATDASFVLPAPKRVHLLAPEDPLAVGPTRFRLVVSDRQVVRVDYYLDGSLAAAAVVAPFEATLDLGKLPHSREVEVVAFGADGGELGRDRMVVNEGAGSLRVTIVSPRQSELRARGLQTGPVDVEAEIKAPRFAGVDRTEFYWNTELVATRFAPPWRHRVIVPEESPRGFVRVVARLADGSSAEDVLFLNTPGSTERVDVSLVELYLVVTDRQGRPVKGLSEEDFRVHEEGTAQQLATFSDAGDLPMTVGLAIDTSVSMFIKLPRVQQAAAEFVLGSMSDKDRGFVVGFGTEPKLHQDTTAEQDGLVAAIGRLRPDGHTAVWKAIVYSLVQLQGVPGRKALILYSDGADEDDEFPYRTCLRFARRLGVPIYTILANNEIYRTGGKSLAIRSYLDRLERLTGAVGGRVYLTRVGDDLGEIYAEIADELRSQYLVTYYPQGRSDDEWRRVEVDVTVPGLKARTVSGYYR